MSEDMEKALAKEALAEAYSRGFEAGWKAASASFETKAKGMIAYPTPVLNTPYDKKPKP